MFTKTFQNNDVFLRVNKKFKKNYTRPPLRTSLVPEREECARHSALVPFPPWSFLFCTRVPARERFFAGTRERSEFQFEGNSGGIGRRVAGFASSVERAGPSEIEIQFRRGREQVGKSEASAESVIFRVVG